MKNVLIKIIKILPVLISPLLGNKCRFFPTCSNYFIEALSEHGLIEGLSLGVKRIFKCHPFYNLEKNHGIDFVPITKNKSRKYRLQKIVEGLQKTGWKFENNEGDKNG